MQLQSEVKSYDFGMQKITPNLSHQNFIFISLLISFFSWFRLRSDFKFWSAWQYLNYFNQDYCTLTYDDRKLVMQHFPLSLFLAIQDQEGNDYLNASHYVF